jgi:dihydroorotate dehydrogenase
MGVIYEKILRPWLFRLESERAHEFGVDWMALLGRLAPVCRLLESVERLSPELFRPVVAFGLDFPNAVGLAAGFDKNARAWPAAAALGFGHVEIGTVTALAQPGNPRPRMFRYPEQQAVINRMGFNNEGAEKVAARLSRQSPPGKRRIPLGINLGKSKVAEIDRAPEDYLASFARLADHADYVVLNVSSPNTPGLRELQDESRLRELLAAVTGANRQRSLSGGKKTPPDSSQDRARSRISPDRCGSRSGLRFRPGRIGGDEHDPGENRAVFGCCRGGRPQRGAASRALNRGRPLCRSRHERKAPDHRGGRDHRRAERG